MAVSIDLCQYLRVEVAVPWWKQYYDNTAAGYGPFHCCRSLDLGPLVL